MGICCVFFSRFVCRRRVVSRRSGGLGITAGRVPHSSKRGCIDFELCCGNGLVGSATRRRVHQESPPPRRREQRALFFSSPPSAAARGGEGVLALLSGVVALGRRLVSSKKQILRAVLSLSLSLSKGKRGRLNVSIRLAQVSLSLSARKEGKMGGRGGGGRSCAPSPSDSGAFRVCFSLVVVVVELVAVKACADGRTPLGRALRRALQRKKPTA